MAKSKAHASLHKGHITDARGRKVSQLDPIALRLLMRHDAIPAESLRKITEELNPGEVRGRWIKLIRGVALAFLGITLALLYLHFFSARGIGRWRDPVLLAFGAGYFVIPMHCAHRDISMQKKNFP